MTAALRFLRVMLAVLGLVAGMAAHAEVWGYVDEKGTAHFAADKVDDRYELFFRGGESFDTRSPMTPRAVTVPTGSAKLIAYFEFSPGYKSVQHHVRAAARANNIDDELLKALIATESGFDAQAVSPRGAVGLMQIMPATAQRYGVTADAKQPVQRKLADPGVNIRTGARYLRDLLNMFPGRLDLALAAYNAGEGAVQRAGNRVPNYRETQNYVKTVMQLYTMLKPPAALTAAPNAGPLHGRIRMQLPGTPPVARREDPSGDGEPVL